METKFIETKFIETKEVLKILSEYYSIKERKKINIKEEHEVMYDGVNVGIDVKFYCDYFLKGQYIKVYLHYDEIYEALKVYTNNLGYNLDNFKYSGTVKRMGFYSDNDVAFFEGINLYLKKNVYTKKKYR